MAQELAEARSELQNRKLIDRAKRHNRKKTLAGTCAAAKQMPPLRGQVK
jgi:hypothetical protein